MTRFGLDYSFAAPISPGEHHSVGSTFAVRYLNGSSPKALTQHEVAALHSGGIDVVAVYETTARRALAGRNAGVVDAQAAVNLGRAVGLPQGRPVYFAVDFDATPGDQGAINEYFRGVNDVLGVHRTGIYGGYWPCSRAANAGVVSYIYQTYAWSGKNLDHRTNVYQYSNGHSVAGRSVDYNHALKADFGQWSFKAAPPPAPKPPPKPEPHGLALARVVYNVVSKAWEVHGVANPDVVFDDSEGRWATALVRQRHGVWEIVPKDWDAS